MTSSEILGKGRAIAITMADIAALADKIGCHPATLDAIRRVESSGFGWFPDGRIKILFEKHWFYKLVARSKRDAAVRAGVARKNWISSKRGGYRDQRTAGDRYRLLKTAIQFDEEAAYQSISIGDYQIMGFNHEICGFPSAKAMFEAFCDSQANQLRAFANFLRKKGLYSALRREDFDRVEQVYNGGGQNGAYARRMRHAAAELRRGKWKNYVPGSLSSATIQPDAVRSHEDLIEDIQGALQAAGYDPHGIDGIVGPLTEAAYADWARGQGRPERLIIKEETLKAIRLTIDQHAESAAPEPEEEEASPQPDDTGVEPDEPAGSWLARLIAAIAVLLGRRA